MRRRYRQAQDRAEAIHRPNDAATADRRGSRRAADARIPARAAAGGVPRPIERQERSHRRQCAGRDLQRKAVACRLPARACRTCRAWMSSISSRTACRRPAARSAASARTAAARGCRARRRRRRQRTGEVCDQPQRGGAQGQDRSADRPQARGRAHHRDPLPPAQEQSALRRRGRRRQDRDRRRAWRA